MNFNDNTELLMIIPIFFILYWQYFKRTNNYKGYKFNWSFKTSIYFSSPLNKIVQGVCKAYPSPKLILFLWQPSQKSKPRFNWEKTKFNRDEYNFNGINWDLSEILSQQDFIVINSENLGLTRLISVSLNENWTKI